MHGWQRSAALAAGTSVLVGLSGLACGRHATSLLGPNQRPQLEILDARVDPVSHAGVRVRWAARDPDGRVASYRWDVRPFGGASPATAAVVTSQAECVAPTTLPTRASHGAREPELFTLWAVDAAGAVSEPAH